MTRTACAISSPTKRLGESRRQKRDNEASHQPKPPINANTNSANRKSGAAPTASCVITFTRRKKGETRSPTSTLAAVLF